MDEYYKTQNDRGYMHPLAGLSQQFVLFAKTAAKPVMDMGCAYGNTVLAALEAGAKNVVACDMEQKHLRVLQDQAAEKKYTSRLITKLGIFPEGYSFDDHSFAAIHVSHVLEYLTGEEVERGLSNFYSWLGHGGKLFILTYTIYIKELANERFQAEYEKRLREGVKWPGYLAQYDDYMSDDIDRSEEQDSPFPPSLHMFALDKLSSALENAGFVIESANYIDGRSNGAVEETWHNGREYLGIIACKL